MTSPDGATSQVRKSPRTTTHAVTNRNTRVPDSISAQPTMTNGIVFESRCPQLACRNGWVTIPHSPSTWRGLTPNLSQL